MNSKTYLIFSLLHSCLFFFPVNGDQNLESEDEEDDAQLYELAELPNGETSDVSSEAEGGPAEEQLEKSESDDKDAASNMSESVFHFQKSVIEDIRFVFSHKVVSSPAETSVL